MEENEERGGRKGGVKGARSVIWRSVKSVGGEREEVGKRRGKKWRGAGVVWLVCDGWARSNFWCVRLSPTVDSCSLSLVVLRESISLVSGLV